MSLNPRSKRPTQAVILAGGRGKRLQPLTNTRPKSMVEFHGKPFMAYVIDMLAEQGFKHVLLLLGYLPEVIMDYFGDGSKWGIKIEYSVSSPDDLTASRVKLVRTKIDEHFMLLYCDNYWPMQFDKMWQKYLNANVKGLITVYGNKDGYSRDSIIVGENDIVEVFDRSRTTPGLKGVEISYAILRKSVLDLLPEEDELFEQAVYPALAKQGELVAYVSDHRYYSVGSHEKLSLTEQFFLRQPTLILDRDGVINAKPPKAQYVTKWQEFQWLPGVKQAMKLLKEAGYKIIIISNQAGIARGFMSESDLNNIHAEMKKEVLDSGGRIDAIYYCPHHWDEGCECRKPNAGMIFQAQHEHHLDLTRTILVGDDERDAQAANNAGCQFVLVHEEYGLLDFTQDMLKLKGVVLSD